jgi:hypothetical protein
MSGSLRARLWPNERPGVDAGRRVLLAFHRSRTRAIQVSCSAEA